MELEERIKRCSNMIEIEHIIFACVWWDFAEKFAKEYRPFNRKKESQESWQNSVIEAYRSDIVSERKRLFSLIPERFYKTIAYKQLSDSINAQ